MPPKKIMLVNALDPEEVRVAVLRGGGLDELYVETHTPGAAAGSIYKGRVVNFEPSLEAAFVELGTGKHGFLHASDVSCTIGGPNSRRVLSPVTGPSEKGGNSGAGTAAPSKRGVVTKQARSYLKPGREILVQVKKETVGDKGPALTTFVGLPGRYLVLMPSLGRIGVSRRIRDKETRDALKKIMADVTIGGANGRRVLSPLAAPSSEGPVTGVSTAAPSERGVATTDLGFVIRTEARKTGARELRKDADELLARWSSITERDASVPAPALLWEEADLTVRALRDYLTSDTREVWLDEPAAYEQARSFIADNIPALKRSCRLYDGAEPIFAHFGVEAQMEALVDWKVTLDGGGHICIEQTEAMAVVDVNSGRTRHRKSSASMILQTNLEAAREVARQLRLRDIGGLVVIDFIDMEDVADRKRVEAEFVAALEPDKARTTVLPISGLGILEMTRQRRRPALETRTSAPCPLCASRGLVRSTESLSIAFLRELRSRLSLGGDEGESRRVVARFHPQRALEIANRLRRELGAIEKENPVEVVFREDHSIGYGSFELDVDVARHVVGHRRSRTQAARPAAAPRGRAKAEPDAPAPAKPPRPKRKRRTARKKSARSKAPARKTGSAEAPDEAAARPPEEEAPAAEVVDAGQLASGSAGARQHAGAAEPDAGAPARPSTRTRRKRRTARKRSAGAKAPAGKALPSGGPDDKAPEPPEGDKKGAPAVGPADTAAADAGAEAAPKKKRRRRGHRGGVKHRKKKGA